MTGADERPIDRLIVVMTRLRDPDGGCPWDLAQTLRSVAPYAIEEAYEVVDAVERGDLGDLCDELGDLLFQVVFQARLAEEAGAFGFDDVARTIADKMVRRHPHVFADDGLGGGHDHPTRGWEAIKDAERAAKGPAGSGVFDDVPVGLPALLRAVKLTRRAARVGFDWPDLTPVLAKVREELVELEAEVEAGDAAKAREELGDLLFVMANLARKLEVDPEDALRSANAKFVRRFAFIEDGLAARGRTPAQSDLAEMDALWEQAKAAERARR